MGASIRRWLGSPWLLAIVICATYALSLGGGWLDYDDDWLVRDNELLDVRDASVLWRILFDLDRDTRLVLGAELLPVRDLVAWFGRAWLGLDVLGFRVLTLAIYAAGCALLLRWSRSLTRSSQTSKPTADAYLIGAWLFALHPIHAESVAWLAGLKEVLALLFVAGALLAAEERTTTRRVLVVVCLALACGSKSVAIVTPVLLALTDVLRRRSQDVPVLVVSSLVCGAWAALHVWVGRIVGMIAEPLGDGPIERVASVTVIVARYVGLSLELHPHSVIYDVPAHGLDAPFVASLVGLLALVGLAVWAWQRDVRWPAVLLAWFLVSLAPISQLVAPLQNRMADRYLLFAVWAPCVALGFAIERALALTRPQIAAPLLAAVLVVVAALTARRAVLFGDPVELFLEATRETETSAKAPLLLGDALFARERYQDAELAYRGAIARDGFRTDHGRVAGNSLGRLLAGSGRADEAIALYEELVARYPDDPRVLHNLAALEERAGRTDVAAAHRATLAERFPSYRPGAPDRPGPL